MLNTIKEIIYDVISWINQPAMTIGPYDSVYINIGHIFVGYFILSAMGLLWLSFKIEWEV